MVLLIGFWFDGGLFKLPTCVVFWVLLELARRGFLITNYRKSGNGILWPFFRVFRVVRGSNELSGLPVSGRELPCEREERQNVLTAKYTKYAKVEITLRWLAGLFAVAALGLTMLHLGTPQLAVSERTLSIARKFLVPQKEKADFEFLAAKNIWSNTPLKTLLQHAHLANYNRTLVNWKLDDQLYREFVLSPEIVGVEVTSRLGNALLTSCPTTDLNWRRPLWEYFYPRIRKESSLEAAAEIVVRHLRERVIISEAVDHSVDIQSIWQSQITASAGFDRIYVAALRSAGIPARLATSGNAEFWNGAEWKPSLRPVEAKGRVKVE